jgi:outer membrane protein assembly factor BamB
MWVMDVADGLELLPGDDGELPVSVRWVVSTETPEAVAVAGDTLYVAGFTLAAYDMADGSLRWEYGDDEGMEASGGVRIGADGPDVIRVFAPWEFDVRVGRHDGALVSRGSAGGGPPADFVSLAAPPPTTFRVVADLEETTAYWPDGRVAWRLRVESPAVDPAGVLETDGVIVCVTSSEHVVALDPVGA